MVKKITIMNRFILHTLHSNITSLAITTRKTTKKNNFINVGAGWKKADFKKPKKKPNRVFRRKFSTPFFSHQLQSIQFEWLILKTIF